MVTYNTRCVKVQSLLEIFIVLLNVLKVVNMRLIFSLSNLKESLISRAKAKQIAMNFATYREVEIDFARVEYIGQGFADEMFRVWPLKNPEIRLYLTNANPHVVQMINHVTGRKDLPQANNIFF